MYWLRSMCRDLPCCISFDDGEGKAYVNVDADTSEDCVDEAIASCPVQSNGGLA